MTGCFILDFRCHAENLEGWFWALPWMALYVGALVGSWAGAKWGYPVPIALSVAGLLRFIPQPKPPEPEPESPDFQPPWSPIPFRRPKPSTQPPKPGTRQRFNPDTGKFERY